jgi:hypothetical protein
MRMPSRSATLPPRLGGRTLAPIQERVPTTHSAGSEGRMASAQSMYEVTMPPSIFSGVGQLHVGRCAFVALVVPALTPTALSPGRKAAI